MAEQSRRAHPGVLLDAVEQVEPVVQAAKHFRHINRDLLRQPNVTVGVDDGRNDLMLTRRRYDVVMVDISLPIHAGANNLYSAEYFLSLPRDRPIDLSGVRGDVRRHVE